MNGKKRLQKLRLNHFLSGWLWLLLAFGTGLLLLRGSYGPPAWQTFWQPTFFQLIKGDHFFDSQTIWVDLADHALTKEEQSSINQLAQSKRSVAFYSVEMMPGVSRNPNKTQEEALQNSGLIRYIEPISLSFVDSGFVGQLIPTQQQAYLPPRYRLLSHDAGENSIELTTTLHLTTMIKRNNATEWQDVINSVQAIRPAEPVWVMHAAEEPRVVSLSEFLSQQVPENTAQVVFFNSQQSGTLVEDVESLLAGLYAVDLPYYLIGMLGLIVLGVIFFTVSLRLTLSTTTLLIITAIALQWALQWWLLKTYQWWLPTFESSLLLVLAGVLGWLEKMHQKPLGQWLVTRQVWGRHSAESLAEQHQYTQAFDTLKQLQADQHVKSQAYKLAQACERKRDFALAGDIYLWLNQFGKGYEDSRERAEKLAKVTKATTSLVGTIALDQTLLMPGEDLQPPTLGRYRIDSVLGSGAMGVVYKGIDPAINREVAVKTLALNREFESQDQQTARDRFFREAETAGRLNHPNIVTIYDVGEEKDLAFIAMDLLTGSPLDQHSKPQHLLPVVKVYQIMIQITAGLAYAHNKGVVHRDIKPGNIIFDEEKQLAVITDFGIAHLTDHSKTRTGAILGSPFFMSPEQIQGHKVDGRSDIFSLGVTFYQLLTGKLPFQGESLATVALNITTKKHEPVRKIRADLPASASRIINKALQKEQEKRFQRVEEFKEALVSALKRDFNVDPYTS